MAHRRCCGPWPQGSRLEPSHSSVDTGANAREGRRFPAATSCSLERSYFCSATTERTLDLLWRRLSIGGHLNECKRCCTAVVRYPAWIATIRQSTDSSHMQKKKFGDMTSCGTRHFPIFVVLVLLAFGCLALYSGFCGSVAYCIYDYGYTPLHQSKFQFATTEFSSENRKSSPTPVEWV